MKVTPVTPLDFSEHHFPAQERRSGNGVVLPGKDSAVWSGAIVFRMRCLAICARNGGHRTKGFDDSGSGRPKRDCRGWAERTDGDQALL